MHPKTLSLLALLLIGLTAISCGSTMSSGMPGRMPANDIAGIVATANEGEIQQGQAALSAASAAEVREFAQMMVNDHTSALSSARDTFARTASPRPTTTPRAACARRPSGR